MKMVRAQVCICGPFQAETAGNQPLSDKSGEHFLSRSGCAGACKAHARKPKFAESRAAVTQEETASL